MPLTELALLHLTPRTTIDNAALRSKLSHAKTVMQNYTGRTFYYMQQTEDPSCIYIIGEWDSLNQHVNHFIPSSDNQALLESLKDDLTADTRLEHLDVAHADLPLPTSAAQREQARRGEIVWGIVHHNVKTGEKQQFLDSFHANKEYLQEFVTEGRIGGGWCVGNEGSEEEVFVLVIPWKSVQQHEEFGRSDGFQKYVRITEFIDGADIKHAKLLDI
jgi:quinol monooxygenase YgiN